MAVEIETEREDRNESLVITLVQFTMAEGTEGRARGNSHKLAWRRVTCHQYPLSVAYRWWRNTS